MGHPRPWTVAMNTVLADGGWHAREDVIAAGVPLVPPGRAYRKGEMNRLHNKTRIGTPAPAVRAKGDESTAIKAGARQLVANCLSAAIARGELERAVVDGVDSLRLTSAQSKAS